MTEDERVEWQLFPFFTLLTWCVLTLRHSRVAWTLAELCLWDPSSISITATLRAQCPFSKTSHGASSAVEGSEQRRTKSRRETRT